jgi:hypothetical protein
MILSYYNISSPGGRCGRIGNMGMKRFLRWPRFRYTLRTFFVVLTVFGIWLGWQVNIVRERRELLRQLEESQSYVLGDFDAGDWINSRRNGLGQIKRKGARNTASQIHPIYISPVRRWLGDQGIYHINLSESLEHDWQEFVRAFPETVVVITPTSNLTTRTLVQFLGERFDADDDFHLSKELRRLAIEILAERKAREAIPDLIRCLDDSRALRGSDNFVGAQAAKALSEITGREFSLDQDEWRQWWNAQLTEATRK